MFLVVNAFGAHSCRLAHWLLCGALPVYIFRVLFAHDLDSRCARLCSYKDKIWVVIQS
jgi:hypothetical protein